MNTRINAIDCDLTGFCRKWQVRELSLFGSALRDDFRPDSDVDFLVSFAPESNVDLFDLVSMKAELESLLGRNVDLVDKDLLRNPWRKREILRTRKVLYAA